MKCERCSSPLNSDDLWCPSCGVWASESKTLCGCEPPHTATGACVVCGTPVCDACSSVQKGVSFCTEPEHRSIHATHARLGLYSSMFEADWVQKNLRIAGVRPEVFTYRDIPAYFGMVLPAEAVVYVLRELEQKAVALVGAYSEPENF